jgi:hypothetical protein
MFNEIDQSTATFPQIVHGVMKKWKHSLQMWKMKDAKSISLTLKLYIFLGKSSLPKNCFCLFLGK